MKRSMLAKTITLALCFTLALTGVTLGKTGPDRLEPVLLPVPDSGITVVVNGQEIKYPVAPIIEEDRILVPIRDLAEQLGAKVQWLGSHDKITVNHHKDSLELTIGESSAYLNGEPIDMGVSTRIKENRAFVPLRFFSEALHAGVMWLPNERKVIIELDPEIKPVDGNIIIKNFIYSPEQLMVTGIARVWEANVLYEVTNKNNKVLFVGFTTASVGAPEWGDFSFSIEGDLSEASVLRVFTESAKDGSRIDIAEYFLQPFGTAKILTKEPASILVEGVLDGYSQQPVKFDFAISPKTIITDANNSRLPESDLIPGDLVQIWISYPGLVLESWPAQAGAGKIVRMTESQVREPADEENNDKDLYIGYISIEKNTLYLDELEWITDEKTERIKELGLSPQSDMPNGYYIYNPSTDTTSFEIAKDTIYNFVAFEDLSYIKKGQDRNYSTMKKEEFIEYLKNVRTDRVPFWVEVKDGYVVSITEQFVN